MADDDKKTDNKQEEVKEEATDEAKVEEEKTEAPVEELKAEEPAEVQAEAPAEEPAEEVKEEPKEEPKVTAEAPKAEPKVEPVAEPKKEEKKPTVKLTGKLEKIAKEIEELTVLELSELSSYLEDKFNVTGTPMMAAPAGAAGGAGAAEPAEEKSSYTVVLTDGGANKLGAIKAVRELRQDLGLMDAKKLVESTPKNVLENVKKDEAEAAVKKLTESGAKAEMK